MTSRKSLRSNSTGETDMAIEANTKVITPEAILSYPNLIEPRADDSDKLWYQCSLVFLPETDISALKQAVLDCAKAQFGDKAVEMLRTGKLKSPFRKDWEAKGYPEGSTFFSCKSKAKPGIVGLAPGKDGKPAPYAGELFAGLKVRASIRPYYYKQQGGGIAMASSCSRAPSSSGWSSCSKPVRSIRSSWPASGGRLLPF